jgi:hypothetical protein
MNLHLLAAKHRLGMLPANDLPQIGIDALEAGFDTPSLCRLAGEDGSDCDESRRLFEKSLSELGIGVPSESEAGMSVGKAIAHQVLSGELGPYEGARQIWAKVYIHNPALKALTVFVGLASEYEDHPEDGAAYLAEIERECRLLVEAPTPDSPPQAPRG